MSMASPLKILVYPLMMREGQLPSWVDRAGVMPEAFPRTWTVDRNSGTVPALLKLLVRMKMRMRFPMLGKLPMDLIQKTLMTRPLTRTMTALVI